LEVTTEKLSFTIRRPSMFITAHDGTDERYGMLPQRYKKSSSREHTTSFVDAWQLLVYSTESPQIMQTHGLDVLLGIARARLRPDERWLDEMLAAAGKRNINSLLGAYTGASRKAAGRALSLTATEHAAIEALSPGLSCERWTLDDVVRATLLLEAARVEGNEVADDHAWIGIASACYENGDAREQQSWLKAISLLPLAERFVAFGIDACRSHIQPTFEAISCDNPYPSAHFPVLNFNQLVLKALFIGVPLARIVGLRRRLNPDLSRMARDYAAERRAAGRSVPADLSLALHDARIEEPVS
jgi:hypothetical protein